MCVTCHQRDGHEPTREGPLVDSQSTQVFKYSSNTNVFHCSLNVTVENISGKISKIARGMRAPVTLTIIHSYSRELVG